MANSSWRTKAEPGIVKSAEQYWKLTTECLKQAEKMTQCAPTSPKFHQRLCQYLVSKLRRALQSASPFNERVRRWHRKFPALADTPEVLKVLFALSKEVESLIEGCCKDEWIQSAIMLTNISEHVSSLSYNLELCTNAFAYTENWRSWLDMTIPEVAGVFNKEVKTVKKIASQDAERLTKRVKALEESSEPSSADYKLATFLLKRIVAPGSRESFEVNFDEEDIMGVKESRSKLGQGASATVYRATWLGAEVAKKRFHGPESAYFEKEVSILGGLSHPNIIPLHCHDKEACFIVMELMDNDLHSLISKPLHPNSGQKPPFSTLGEVETMLQIAQGMRYLHEMRIVHRDLKSMNILVRCANALEVENGVMQVKVADFGLSKTKESSMTYSNQTPNVGTSRWMAPELIKCGNGSSTTDRSESAGKVENHHFKVDVYSFAMVCFEILTGNLPFSSLSHTDVRRKVVGGERPVLPSRCSEKLRMLIESCWSQEPSKRPCFGDICAELSQMKWMLIVQALSMDVPYYFSWNEIINMTIGFHEDELIDEYLCSKVYKGVMPGTSEMVVVKRYERLENEEFLEVRESMLQSKHQNVLAVVGICEEYDERILVEEYTPNGSLHDWLSGKKDHGNKLTWGVRKNICLGVANGMQHLQSSISPKVIPLYMDPHNIMLDENLEPKIGGCDGVTPIQWRIFGCEFSRLITGNLDLHFYGLLLLDIVRGRPSRSKIPRTDLTRKSLSEWVASMRGWALDLCVYGDFRKMIDPALDLQPDEVTEAVWIITIAFLCMLITPERQLSMALVVTLLFGGTDDEMSKLHALHGFPDRRGSIDSWKRDLIRLVRGERSKCPYDHENRLLVSGSFLHCMKFFEKLLR